MGGLIRFPWLIFCTAHTGNGGKRAGSKRKRKTHKKKAANSYSTPQMLDPVFQPTIYAPKYLGYLHVRLSRRLHLRWLCFWLSLELAILCGVVYIPNTCMYSLSCITRQKMEDNRQKLRFPFTVLCLHCKEFLFNLSLLMLNMKYT
ncbi:hypothetical protein J3F84DRAFT_300331 [Trichoderma pleuroticola]